ncbi:MAG: NifB/NifX family molybdenum-iron cluster-binding protein [Verrucomicrobiota bacterium]|nr:NifB/NifX family molybdenum-iron cluster-binding protein [Verrucomicrobiota bacterium]HOA61055.1 NifB/NifX family molybdenum-iron cluster-binding protein [Verrucomicrobiota bacterium]HOU86221.1 NifB/NifX family molybdenum-iron cluster-binding protein [Verrucomicrobiota bacterium]HPK96437.1 NifB/NifX family molybdenum-iron cluster-binding protein [Verrucomicrobiota bacterium]HPV09274.1 NifB/NifX family molybdenum-iron cluster-binding protein [Verrucomicrobiota bacterium]
MTVACGAAMTVAIPIWQERVSPVFDAASRLLVVRRHRGRTVERKEFVLTATSVEALARSVAELGIDVLLCAAVSETLRTALERAGVAVEAHLCGQVEDLLEAFHAGRWRRSEFRMPGCWDPHGPLRLRRGGCRSRRRMQPAERAKSDQKA